MSEFPKAFTNTLDVPREYLQKQQSGYYHSLQVEFLSPKVNTEERGLQMDTTQMMPTQVFLKHAS